MKLLVLWGVLLAAACGDNVRGDITIDPGPWGFAVGELVSMTPYGGLTIGTGGAFSIAVVDDPAVPLEGYSVEPDAAQHWTVHAHDVLGAQYGVADALENLGFRFRHPYDSFIPGLPGDRGTAGPMHRPQIRVRGFQLHTLHPIEPYFALWEPGSPDDAHRIINWIIENRGNYMQWAALDDILTAPDRFAAWQPYTRALLDYAHQRGLRVGLQIELFGQSNLQHAFDLYDDTTGTIPLADEIGQRLPLITNGLPFDVYDLSFGEFFTTEPDQFIAANNEVAKQLRALAPQAEMHALIHDGANQRVEYMGEDLIYYFLVKYADPTIVPDIHTTFFYNLYEPTDGAYHHVDFSEHRQYLLDRMCAQQKAAYHPEDAYWVAFDDSVPQAFPLYIRSRWLDLHNLAADPCAPLDEHLPFSTGWEWGYWLNDVTSMRNSYELPSSYDATIKDELAPDLGTAAGDVVAGIAEDQHTYLMGDALAPYLASRDAAIDLGRAGNIISQPDRITFDDLVSSGDTAGFTTSVLEPLAAYADALDQRQTQLDAVDMPDSRWARELSDGLAIDRLRARFIAAVYRAVVDHLAGTGDAEDDYDRATELEGEAKVLIEGRDADLHDTHGRLLLDRNANQTQYQYGYLRNADTLCFWNRELLQVGAILGNTTTTPPNCLF
jgi:hypothetical protein